MVNEYSVFLLDLVDSVFVTRAVLDRRTGLKADSVKGRGLDRVTPQLVAGGETNVNELCVDNLDDAEAQFRFGIAAPTLSGNEWCCLRSCTHDVGEVATPIVKADSLARKANLVDAIERDSFAAFALHKHLGDSLTVPDDFYLKLVDGFIRCVGCCRFVKRWGRYLWHLNSFQ